MKHSPRLSETTLAQLAPQGLGLELSPYFDPFLLKSDHNILYTDYIDTDAIRAKAAENPGFTDQDLPSVDFVWTPGKPLAECAPPGTQFDYAVASHVMEHVPNPIGWLNEVLSLLKVGGRLALFLPDRRRSSDFFRRETQFPELVQWWIEQPAVPTAGQVLDFMSNSFMLYNDSEVDWTTLTSPSQVKRSYSDKEALSTSIFVHHHGNYLDVHCSVWNALTFKSIFDQIVGAGLLNVEVGEVSSDGFEFMVVLTKLGEPREPAPPRRANGGAGSGLTTTPVVTDIKDIASVDHQLKVVHADLTFLVALVNDNATEIKTLLARVARPSLARRARNWLKRRL